MELNVNQKILSTDPSADNLIKVLSDNAERAGLSDSILYHNFPIYAGDQENLAANVLLVSRLHGVIIFQCGEQKSKSQIENNLQLLLEKLEHIFGQIYSKLIRNKSLRKKPTELKVNVFSSLFFPFAEDIGFVDKNDLSGFIILSNERNLLDFLSENLIETPIEENLFKEIISILEGSKGIIQPKQRLADDGKVKGKILRDIESLIANFDLEQKRSALSIVDGFQRIRGLAGSGKTIVLAMKAALIHLQDPNALILYTFYTKSLYAFIKKLITRFYRQFADEDPNWDKIKILHAWGGSSLGGVYYNTCLENNVMPLPLQSVKEYGPRAFDRVCEMLLEKDLIKTFDYAILDEGQDFPKYFYRLCREITKNNRVIWGYDECQNILNIEIQDPKETFGKDDDGNYYVDFSKSDIEANQDIVLHNCYRNPGKTLMCAFALGLGIYNERIIQLPENNEHWEDLGFDVIEGSSNEGDLMKITRPIRRALEIKEEILGQSELIRFKDFDNYERECEFVIESILKDLKEGLSPEDILIISLDDVNARTYFGEISSKLNKHGIKTFNMLSAPPNTKEFTIEEQVTLTTVYRAKGNEAGSVYITGVDSIFYNKDSIQERNKLFTAMTRAKAWVTITGTGDMMSIFTKEIEKTLANYPNLIFYQPNRDSLKVFQRDLEKKQAAQNKLSRVLEEISQQSGEDRQLILEEFIQKERRKVKKNKGRDKNS